MWLTEVLIVAFTGENRFSFYREILLRINLVTLTEGFTSRMLRRTSLWIMARKNRIDTFWKLINIHAYLWFFYRSLGWRSGIVWTSILHDRNSDAYSRLSYISYSSNSIINTKQRGCLWRADNCWKMYSCLTSLQFTSGQKKKTTTGIRSGTVDAF